MLLLGISWGGLRIVPGEEAEFPGLFGPSYFDHGWPLTFLRRGIDKSDTMSEYAWWLGDGVVEFHIVPIVLDVAVVALAVAAFVALWERWQRKRRRWQFSLRSLFVVVTSTGVLLGWWINERQRDQQLRSHLKGVASIVAGNAGLSREPRFPLWLRAVLGDELLLRTCVTQPQAATVGWWDDNQDNVRFLVETYPDRIAVSYSGNPSGTELEHLGRLKSLRWIETQNASDRVLTALCSDRKLLQIFVTSYRNAGKMQWTTPTSWLITDRGLEIIAENRSLESLWIGDVSLITDRGLFALARLTNLSELSLVDSKLSDAAIEVIQRELPKLKITRRPWRQIED